MIIKDQEFQLKNNDSNAETSQIIQNPKQFQIQQTNTEVNQFEKDNLEKKNQINEKFNILSQAMQVKIKFSLRESFLTVNQQTDEQIENVIRIINKDHNERSINDIQLLIKEMSQQKSIQSLISNENNIDKDAKIKILEDLVQNLKYDQYNQNTPVFHFGQKGNKCYFILRGQAVIYIPKRMEDIQFEIQNLKTKVKSNYQTSKVNEIISALDHIEYTLMNNSQNNNNIGHYVRKSKFRKQNNNHILMDVLRQFDQNYLEDVTILKDYQSQYFIEGFNLYKRATILNQNCIFGELALSLNKPRQASVFALSQLDLATISKKEYIRICKHQIDEYNEKLFLFKQYFKNVKEDRVVKFSYEFSLCQYKRNEILFKEKDQVDNIFFIKQGEIKLLKQFHDSKENQVKFLHKIFNTYDKEIMTIQVGEFFGEEIQCILDYINKNDETKKKSKIIVDKINNTQNKPLLRSYTAIASSNCVVFKLSSQKLNHLHNIYQDLVKFIAEKYLIKKQYFDKQIHNIHSIKQEQNQNFQQLVMNQELQSTIQTIMPGKYKSQEDQIRLQKQTLQQIISKQITEETINSITEKNCKHYKNQVLKNVYKTISEGEKIKPFFDPSPEIQFFQKKANATIKNYLTHKPVHETLKQINQINQESHLDQVNQHLNNLQNDIINRNFLIRKQRQNSLPNLNTFVQNLMPPSQQSLWTPTLSNTFYKESYNQKKRVNSEFNIHQQNRQKKIILNQMNQNNNKIKDLEQQLKIIQEINYFYQR